VGGAAAAAQPGQGLDRALHRVLALKNSGKTRCFSDMCGSRVAIKLINCSGSCIDAWSAKLPR
jgi:hypothetical protein